MTGEMTILIILAHSEIYILIYCVKYTKKKKKILLIIRLI